MESIGRSGWVALDSKFSSRQVLLCVRAGYYAQNGSKRDFLKVLKGPRMISTGA